MTDPVLQKMFDKRRAEVIAIIPALSVEVIGKIKQLLGDAPHNHLIDNLIVVLCDRRDIEGELRQQLDDETWEELQGMMEKGHSILDDVLAILKDEYDIEPTDEDNGEAA
jgi:hypothetical protein